MKAFHIAPIAPLLTTNPAAASHPTRYCIKYSELAEYLIADHDAIRAAGPQTITYVGEDEEGPPVM